MAVVSKTGTNMFHGDVFEFLRNTDLDTRNFFSSNVPALIRNQFAGRREGHQERQNLLLRSFQALNEHPQAVANESVVPTGAERTGDFSGASGLS